MHRIGSASANLSCSTALHMHDVMQSVLAFLPLSQNLRQLRMHASKPALQSAMYVKTCTAIVVGQI